MRESFGGPRIVCIKESEPLTPGVIYCVVAARGETSIVFIVQHTNAGVSSGNPTSYLESCVAGSIIDHDDLKVRHRLGKSAVQGPLKSISSIVGGYNDAYKRRTGLIGCISSIYI